MPKTSDKSDVNKIKDFQHLKNTIKIDKATWFIKEKYV